MKERIKEKIKEAPHLPGVYIFKEDGIPLYIGKASDLKQRLENYLHNQESPRFRVLSKRATELEIIITRNEAEALLFEANLIKKFQPRYNIRLKDDKKYPYIKITTNEVYPRIALTRNLKEEGITIFGPYTSAKAVRKTIRSIRKIFPIRTCKYKLPSKRTISPCMDYYIGKCVAPCIPGKVKEEEYQNLVKNVIQFLKGNTEELERKLEREMWKSSQKLEFEKAASIRDQIMAIRELKREQTVHTLMGENKDIVAVSRVRNTGLAFIIFVRSGKVVDTEHYFLDIRPEDREEEILAEFLIQYYSTQPNPPEAVVVDKLPENSQNIQNALEKITLRAAKGDEKKLVELARINAVKVLEEELGKKEGISRVHPALVELKEYFKLEKIPLRIEACDISQLFGTNRVGSFVVSVNGRLKKSLYKRFKIKSERIKDDPHMIYEIVKRRLKYEPLPDLILVDGGVAQLNFAKQAGQEMNKDVFIVAFAKRFDDLFLETGERIMIPPRSHAFRLLKILRDEAHRFAVSYHRLLRGKKQKETDLLYIPGVGEKTLKKLYQHFGSLKKIRNASVEELARVKGIGKKKAEIIYNYLHPGAE